MLLDSYSTSLLLLKTNPLKFMVTLPQGRGSVSYLASHLGLNLGGVKELKNEFGAKKWIWTIPSHLPFGKKMLLKNEFWLCPPTYLFFKKNYGNFWFCDFLYYHLSSNIFSLLLFFCFAAGRDTVQVYTKETMATKQELQKMPVPWMTWNLL